MLRGIAGDRAQVGWQVCLCEVAFAPKTQGQEGGHWVRNRLLETPGGKAVPSPGAEDIHLARNGRHATASVLELVIGLVAGGGIRDVESDHIMQGL